MGKTDALTDQKPGAQATLVCFHCKEDCPDDRLQIEDKHFCCAGCQMVYEILNTHDLCQFYTLDEQPGLSQKESKDIRSFAWLDDPEVTQQLLQFTDGQTSKVSFYIPAMHCASCIWLLEHLYRLNEGIIHSKVNFLKKTVVIHFEEKQTNLRQIAALLASIGYAPEINLGDVSNGNQPKAIDRSLLYKIGVAGFCFWEYYAAQLPGIPGLA